MVRVQALVYLLALIIQEGDITEPAQQCNLIRGPGGCAHVWLVLLRKGRKGCGPYGKVPAQPWVMVNTDLPHSQLVLQPTHCAID